MVITGPQISVVPKSISTLVIFEGPVQVGDTAVFVPSLSSSADDIDCENQPSGSVRALVETGAGAQFTFDSVGRYVLCYRFNFLEFDEAVRPAGKSLYTLYADIRLGVVAIDTSLALPHGTATGCESTVRMPGSGFFSLGADMPTPRCCFGDGCSLLGVAAEVQETMLTCKITGSVTAVSSLSIEFGSYLSYPVLDTFTIYNMEMATLDLPSPFAGSYNLATELLITGNGLADFGIISCLFHDQFVSTSGRFVDATTIACTKPAFPDAARLLTEVSLEVAFNGQCYTDTNNSFTLYNAYVDSIEPAGAPSDVTFDITVYGGGFVDLEESLCAYVPPTDSGLPTLTTPLSIVSEMEAICSSPDASSARRRLVGDKQLLVAESPGRALSEGSGMVTYGFTVLLNGQQKEPSLLNYDPDFFLYDIAAIQISSLLPASAQSDAATAITVLGSGFKQLGANEIVCSIGTTKVAGALLGTLGNVIECEPTLLEGTSVAIQVSLNQGVDGTFTEPKVLELFSSPFITGVEPVSGPAAGGTIVTITGSGFTSLSEDEAVRTSQMRCQFGTIVQPAPPISHTDTEVVCTTTIGPQMPVVVSVALNGQAFAPSEEVFTFKGYHKPQIIEAFFHESATKIVLVFDNQDTNRAGMNGLEACSSILDVGTVAAIQGVSRDPPECEWEDDVTLVIYLSERTEAAPGMAVGIIAGVLWPKEAAATQSDCTAAGNLCASAQSAIIDSYLPCDKRATAEREHCIVPTALLEFPDSVSGCNGTEVELDASASAGGGAKQLTYTWSVHPTLSDSYYPIMATLGEQLADTVSLSSELDGGVRFEFMVTATNFLGSTSTPTVASILRMKAPTPSVRIKGGQGGLLSVRKGSPSWLFGQMQIAPCFRGDRKMDFTWQNVLATPADDCLSGDCLAPQLLQGQVDSTVLARTRDIDVGCLEPVSRCLNPYMKPRVEYTFKITGCMVSSEDICSEATTRVRLRDEKLVAVIDGGDRTLTAGTEASIDGCTYTEDPDDEDAVITFSWRCETAAGPCDLSAEVQTDECSLLLPANSLAVGEAHVFTLTASCENGETQMDSVRVSVEEGVVPEVSVTVIGEPKPAATEKFVLQGYSPNIMVESNVAIGGSGSVVETTEVEASYTWIAYASSSAGNNATSDGMQIIDLADSSVTTARPLGPHRPPCPFPSAHPLSEPLFPSTTDPNSHPSICADG